ncbi:MAG: tetratricopeptide repeat protein [Saprospiraceae bacterium]|nr:tetratricopeptide repeat protein [Saprospiraceae bacterium]
MHRVFLFAVLLGSLLIQCKQKETSDQQVDQVSELGELQHHFNLNAGTASYFNKGLLLLHNFEYDDALAEFQKGIAVDSTEIMLHWGEAMAYYKALWGLQNTDQGQKILLRFGAERQERLASIDDPLEKDLWEGLEIIYDDGPFEEQNQKFSKHMEGLHLKYKGHQEISAFYVLSLIWATEEYGDGSPDLHRAASIADEILAINPHHPGALHYKIHALDGPLSAAGAHQAADAYAKVAPDAAHALHMPSHIYLALGEWSEVVSSNIASYEASVKRMEKLGLKDGARGYHSFAWLHYGLLQQGRYKEAEQLLKDMLTHVPKDPTKGARVYLLGMQNRQLVEAGSFSEEVQLDLDVKVEDLGLEAESMKSYLIAQLAMEDQDMDAIEHQIDWLNQRKSVAETIVRGGSVSMCSGGATRYAPTENILKSTEVVIAQMQAMIARLNDDDKLYEQHLLSATNIESETDYPTGPVRIALPSFEAYGDWLLNQERYEEALHQFDQALERMPQRTKSLMGKLAALKELGKQKEANEITQRLRSIWHQADPEVLKLVAQI